MGWIGLGLLSYVPLAIHELGNDASELRAAIAFLVDGGSSASVSLPARLPIVGLRVLGWPLAGLVTSAPVATILAVGLVVGLAMWRGWLRRGSADADGFAGRGVAAAGARRADEDPERTAVRWLALGLLWTVIALAAGASSLATVVVGLPNDHYHAFADPMVIVLVAVGLASVLRLRPTQAALIPRIAVVAVVVALVGWNLTHQPPARVADGGWAAAQSAATRIVAATGDRPIVLASLPTFKSDEAVRMPLAARGVDLTPAASNGTVPGSGPRAAIVVLCDQLFHELIGADCGGSAEDAWVMAASTAARRPSDARGSVRGRPRTLDLGLPPPRDCRRVRPCAQETGASRRPPPAQPSAPFTLGALTFLRCTGAGRLRARDLGRRATDQEAGS